MIEFARLPQEERNTYFEEAANRRALRQLIVEKDFWVCFALKMLFGIPEIIDKFIFKGGTSLSKVFNVIKRFSEDIDISIDPEWLGFAGDNSPASAPSGEQFNKRLKSLNQACHAAVEQQVMPLLEAEIQDAIGQPANSNTYLDFNIDEETKSSVLIFNYPTYESRAGQYILPQVKFEFGSLADQRPKGSHTITPWVAKEFPELLKDAQIEVSTLELERTFWEKVTILHAEYHRHQDSPMRSRLSRDYYDIYCLSLHPSGRKAIQMIDVLADVVKFKQTYFKSSWANYEEAKPPTLKLAPPDHRIEDLKKDYRAMHEMFLESPPTFDEIITQSHSIEKEINNDPNSRKK
ncbi:nucleotidyl transferase AbiEii/AbiGii toxin family protein [Verrucomicrobiota bacterium]